MRRSVLTLFLFVISCGSGLKDPLTEEPLPPQVEAAEPEPSVTDSRELPPTRVAASPPPAVSGGTLWAGREFVIAAESDRDQVHILTLTDDEQRPLAREASLVLRSGDEPGRVVEGNESYYVVLRGAGEIARISPPGEDGVWEVSHRFSVCPAPRGLAFADGELWVACMDGGLHQLDAQTGDNEARIQLGADLRDVVVTPEAMFVSTFRAARVFVLDREGSPVRTISLDRLHLSSLGSSARRVANTAYRMVAAGEGDAVLITHQASKLRSLVDTTAPSVGIYGATEACHGALVEGAITLVNKAGHVRSGTQGTLVLPVDIAFHAEPQSDKTSGIAVAVYGARAVVDRKAARGFPTQSVVDVHPDTFDRIPSACSTFPLVAAQGLERTVAVAFTAGGVLLHQTTNPHTVKVVGSTGVALPGPANFDAGADLFSGDAGRGIACASCHPEGGEDGLTWHFEDLGPRRTQDLRGGVMGSAPFHWDGVLPDITALVNEVMGHRMGGPPMNDFYVGALERFLATLTLPASPALTDPETVARGRALFESEAAACATCHAGPRLTGPGQYDVGTGLAAEIPSLRGLQFRAPYMHDGCATTLAERFDPDCGGSSHGSVAHLSHTELSDLIAYLASL